jgi:peptidoglycan/xylan/chitin deacetylase (PgdA/CDA1 family)
MSNYPATFSRLCRLPVLMTVAACLAFSGTKAEAQVSIPQDSQSAVIFTYHHIGDDLNPTSNLSRAQFESQIEELKTGNYHVLQLTEIVDKLKAGEKLPNPTIALTFDGAHRNTLNYAAPLLMKAELPFTIFIATDALDSKSSGSLGWDEIRRLKRNNLVTIGLHPASYQKIYDKDKAEISRQINKAQARYREELNETAGLFAYPFGEFSLTYKDIIETQGFKAAFGQQSGVAYAGTDMFALPRFSMTYPYGDIERFRMTALALPLPANDIAPHDPYIRDSKPEIGFTIDETLKGQIKSMSCFSSTSEKAKLQVLGGNRVEIRLDKPFEDERGRINCTMPGPIDEASEQPRWRWYGMLLTKTVSYDDYEPAASEESDTSSNLPDEIESSVE